METYNLDDVLHEVMLPRGYFVSVSGDYLPWFDNEGRQLGLLLHRDGTVTWRLRGRNGEVLEPVLNYEKVSE